MVKWSCIFSLEIIFSLSTFCSWVHVSLIQNWTRFIENSVYALLIVSFFSRCSETYSFHQCNLSAGEELPSLYNVALMDVKIGFFHTLHKQLIAGLQTCSAKTATESFFFQNMERERIHASDFFFAIYSRYKEHKYKHIDEQK